MEPLIPDRVKLADFIKFLKKRGGENLPLLLNSLVIDALKNNI